MALEEMLGQVLMDLVLRKFMGDISSLWQFSKLPRQSRLLGQYWKIYSQYSLANNGKAILSQIGFVNAFLA
jgi:hypothetical protein